MHKNMPKINGKPANCVVYVPAIERAEHQSIALSNYCERRTCSRFLV